MDCKQVKIFRAGKDFICSGINNKPVKFKGDIIKICFKSKYVKRFFIEMTASEAKKVISALMETLNNIQKKA